MRHAAENHCKARARKAGWARPRRRPVATADTQAPENSFEIMRPDKLFRLPRVGIVFAIGIPEGNKLAMIRTRLKSTGKRIVVIGLLCAFVAGAGLNSTDSATMTSDEWIRSQTVARVRWDTAQILEVVRRHRPSADDAWRQRLADTIVAEALAAQTDPLFIAAIVAHESSFKSRIVSHAGAVGLMQLRPWVAEDMAQRSDVEWHGVSTLHDPQLNVRLGIRYYKELLDRFGNAQTALTAYCYGPSRVALQLRQGTFDGSGYARDILDFHERLAERFGA